MPDRDKVESLAAKIQEYFHQRDFRLYSSLFHHRTRWELFGMRKDHKQRVEQRYVVTPYVIDKYSQPPWSIFETHRFDPEPTHSIQLSLKFPEDDGVEELYFACAPADGGYKICDYVSRQPSEPSPAVSEVELAPLFEELRGLISDGIQSVGNRLDGRPLGFIRLDYSVDPYPCSVSLYPYLERLDTRNWRKMIHTGGEYLHSELLAKYFRAVFEGSPRLTTLDGRSIDLAQKEFDQQFPDWIGERYFKEAIKSCMMRAMAKCLAEASCRQVLSWQGGKDAVVASHEELENKLAALRQGSPIEGITLYEIAGDSG